MTPETPIYERFIVVEPPLETLTLTSKDHDQLIKTREHFKQYPNVTTSPVYPDKNGFILYLTQDKNKQIKLTSFPVFPTFPLSQPSEK